MPAITSGEPPASAIGMQPPDSQEGPTAADGISAVPDTLTTQRLSSVKSAESCCRSSTSASSTCASPQESTQLVRRGSTGLSEGGSSPLPQDPALDETPVQLSATPSPSAEPYAMGAIEAADRVGAQVANESEGYAASEDEHMAVEAESVSGAVPSPTRRSFRDVPATIQSIPQPVTPLPQVDRSQSICGDSSLTENHMASLGHPNLNTQSKGPSCSPIACTRLEYVYVAES